MYECTHSQKALSEPSCSVPWRSKPASVRLCRWVLSGPDAGLPAVNPEPRSRDARFIGFRGQDLGFRGFLVQGLGFRGGLRVRMLRSPRGS